MKLNALIVDDEKYSRDFLNSILSRNPEIKIVGELEDGDKVIESITRQDVDIIFLDIAMPAKSGIELAKQLWDITEAHIIFITGYAEYAAMAFDMDAVDYIMKPYDEARVGRALKRVKQKILEKQKAEIKQIIRRMEVPNKLIIKNERDINVITVNDIILIEKQDRKCFIHTPKKIIETYDSLDSLEKQLDSHVFFRTHQSYLVNINEIEKIERWGDRTYKIKLSGLNIEVSLSRSKAKIFERIIQSNINIKSVKGFFI